MSTVADCEAVADETSWLFEVEAEDVEEDSAFAAGEAAVSTSAAIPAACACSEHKGAEESDDEASPVDKDDELVASEPVDELAAQAGAGARPTIKVNAKKHEMILLQDEWPRACSDAVPITIGYLFPGLMTTRGHSDFASGSHEHRRIHPRALRLLV